MLWITGAAALVRRAAEWQETPWLQAWAKQLSHVDWDGLRAYDLIFPLFMLLSGIAIPFSFDGRLERGVGKSSLFLKILFRVVVLVSLGMIYNGLLSSQPGPPRLASVLGQIGIAWGIAASAHLIFPTINQRIVLTAGVITTITILHLWVPVPGFGARDLTQTGAMNAWLDRQFLPGSLYGLTFDPEGLLCIFSACSLTLAGSTVGSVLRRSTSYTWTQCAIFAATGAALIGLGTIWWKLGYLPIKALWSGTFDLLAIGISMMIFAVFFGIIDVARLRSWSFPLRVIGMNSLTIYLLILFVDFSKPAELLSGRIAVWGGSAGPVILAAAVLIIEWLVLWFLYRKRIFLRV